MIKINNNPSFPDDGFTFIDYIIVQVSSFYSDEPHGPWSIDHRDVLLIIYLPFGYCLRFRIPGHCVLSNFLYFPFNVGV